jgi:hypothetical protein
VSHEKKLLFINLIEDAMYHIRLALDELKVLQDSLEEKGDCNEADSNSDRVE